MLLPPSSGHQRRLQFRCLCAPRSRVATMLCLLVIISSFAGCATFGRRGPVAQKVADCRELSRQGAAAIEQGQWQRAELLLQQAIEASPEDPDAHLNLAEALWHRGATQQALRNIDIARAGRPTDARLAVRAGEMSLAMGAPEPALDLAEQAIRIDPQLAAAWTLRGRTFWKLQQPERAIADLQRALEFDPNNAEVLLDLAVMYRQRGQPARCLTTLHHLHDCSPVDHPQSALVLEGLTLLDLGRPHQASEVFLTVTERGPADAQLLYYLARAHYEAGRYRESAAAAQQALAADASHQPSRQLLVQLASHDSPAAEPQRR